MTPGDFLADGGWLFVVGAGALPAALGFAAGWWSRGRPQGDLHRLEQGQRGRRALSQATAGRGPGQDGHTGYADDDQADGW